MRRKRRHSAPAITCATLIVGLVIALFVAIISQLSSAMLLLTTNCLAGAPGCSCSWRGGKFVADCSQLNLKQVPKNDYLDYLLANAGNNQMPTLNRDIQQLNLASNNISALGPAEFHKKKFTNLQKIYLARNQLFQVHSSAFYKLTGLIELDLSENSLASLANAEESDGGDIAIDNDQDFDAQIDAKQEEAPEAMRNNVSEISSASRSQEFQEDFRTSSKKLDRTKPTTTTGTKTTRLAVRGRSGSFLRGLSQLRQLNLASNQLKRIDQFTFSPLTQLRQLILSRNQIGYIDKRAFDGLDVLNILHLDGNKLSHLDGEVLLKLPQLHSIQLAGSNLWRCDCRLRQLVRHLRPRTRQGANILQDEPRCAPRASYFGSNYDYNGGDDDDDNDDYYSTSRLNEEGDSSSSNFADHHDLSLLGKAEVAASESKSPESQAQLSPAANNKQADGNEQRLARAWTKMKLADFECPPRLAWQFMPQAAGASANADRDNEQEPPKGTQSELVGALIMPQAQQVMNMNDKKTASGGSSGLAVAAAAAATTAAARFRATVVMARRQHYLEGEPMELTCAFALTDELDLELAQVEWWELSRTRKPVLLWRSSTSASATGDARTASVHNNNHDHDDQDNHDSQGDIGREGPAMKDEPVVMTSLTSGAFGQAPRRDYAVTDYVTRANGSSGASFSDDDDDDRRQHQWPASSAAESELVPGAQVARGTIEQQPERRRTATARDEMRLIRVSHLIAGSMTSEQQQQQPPSPTSADGAHVAERIYLCRVSNQAGRLDVVHSISVESPSSWSVGAAPAASSVSEAAQLEWRQRQELRAKLQQQPETLGVSLAASIGAISSSWSLGQAKAAVAKELQLLASYRRSATGELDSPNARGAELLQKRPLFIPVHVAEEILRAADTSAAGAGGYPMTPAMVEAAASASLARSLSQQQQQQLAAEHQRPATRQTNGTIGGLANSTITARIVHLMPGNQPADSVNSGASPSSLHTPAAATNKHSLHSIALGLISRFTSNKRSLIEPGTFAGGSSQGREDLSNQLGSNPGDQNRQFSVGQQGVLQVAFGGDSRPLGARLAMVWRLFYARHLDRWIQLAIGEAPILMGVCGGLLAGCLLTILIVVRLKCSRSRVADCETLGSGSVGLAKSPRATKRLADEENHGDDDEDGDGDDEDEGDDDDCCRKKATAAAASRAGGGRISLESPSDERESNSSRTTKTTKFANGGGGSSSSTTNGSQRRLIVSSSSDDGNLRGKRGASDAAGGASIYTISSRQQQSGRRASQQALHVVDSSPCQSDELNMNCDEADMMSGTLDADLDDSIGSHQARPFMNSATLQGDHHFATLCPAGLQSPYNRLVAASSYFSADFGQRQSARNNRLPNNNSTLPSKHRLILVTPAQQAEMRELVQVSPYYNDQQEMLASGQPDLDSSLIAYQCSATGNHQQQQQGQVLACDNTNFPLLPYQSLQYLDQHWPAVGATTSCEEASTTIEDSSPSLLLPNGNFEGLQQQQFTVVAGPGLRLTGCDHNEAAAAYAVGGGGGHICNTRGGSLETALDQQSSLLDPLELLQHQQEQPCSHQTSQRRHLAATGCTLPARKLHANRMASNSCYKIGGDQHQANSLRPRGLINGNSAMASPAASTSSSTMGNSTSQTATTTNNSQSLQSVQDQCQTQNQRRRRLKFADMTDLGGLAAAQPAASGGQLLHQLRPVQPVNQQTRAANLLGLEDALQLLESSVVDCYRQRFNGKNINRDN